VGVEAVSAAAGALPVVGPEERESAVEPAVLAETAAELLHFVGFCAFFAFVPP